LIDHKATVRLDGGDLQVEWLMDGSVQMTGPTTFVFSGEVAL
jgi:diaminopimelate epimerase